MKLNMQRINFYTKDNVRIEALFNRVNPEVLKTVVMLHMMPAMKESWLPLMTVLHTQNINSLALDLRGHGKSLVQNNQLIDYQNFTDSDHQNSIFDLEAAIQWLMETEKIDAKNIYLAGASFGANLVLWYGSRHPEIHKIALLSPGLNYRGLMSLPLIRQLKPTQEIMIMAGNEDQNNFESLGEIGKTLAENTRSKCHLEILPSDAHGTNLFNFDPKLMTLIVEWFAK